MLRTPICYINCTQNTHTHTQNYITGAVYSPLFFHVFPFPFLPMSLIVVLAVLWIQRNAFEAEMGSVVFKRRACAACILCILPASESELEHGGFLMLSALLQSWHRLPIGATRQSSLTVKRANITFPWE